jgi:hypothetical protein
MIPTPFLVPTKFLAVPALVAGQLLLFKAFIHKDLQKLA